MSEIISAKNIGFCMGVQKAFTKALECGRTLKKVCCYGEIVHNRFALEELSDTKIVIKDDLDQIISDNSIENVIIRAHGIPPTDESLLRQSKNVIDLTCPNVKKVQRLAAQLTEKNFFIIILGKIDHPEVKGICGYCKNNFLVVRNLTILQDNLEKITNQSKLALISQTTANINDFMQISDFLQKNFPQTEIHKTLCNAPRHIQDDAVNLAKEVDLMIVIGDKQSANTTTLYNLCHDQNENCFFAEVPEDLQNILINGNMKIGIAAGTSTPNSQIDKIVKTLTNK